MARRRGKKGSVGSYWRALLTERPDWLKAKKNVEIMERYRKDHGIGENAAVPKNIVANLANIKSVMRKQARRRGRKAALAAGQPAPPRPVRNLEALEIMIDEAMMLARGLDRDGLENVWRHLRTARNQVVLKMG